MTSPTSDSRISVYNRKKDVNIFLTDFGLTVVAWMGDRAHEMEVEVEVELPTMVIKDIRGKMIRIPRDICADALPVLKQAVGMTIKRGLSVMMEETIGGKAGCSHLTNLVMEACYCSFQGVYTKSMEIAGDILEEMTDPERMRSFITLRPQMVDSCITYSEGSRLIKDARELSDTDKVDKLVGRFVDAYAAKSK